MSSEELQELYKELKHDNPLIKKMIDMANECVDACIERVAVRDEIISSLREQCKVAKEILVIVRYENVFTATVVGDALDKIAELERDERSESQKGERSEPKGVEG